MTTTYNRDRPCQTCGGHEFYTGGNRRQCADCARRYAREYRIANAHKVSAQKQAYYQRKKRQRVFIEATRLV